MKNRGDETSFTVGAIRCGRAERTRASPNRLRIEKRLDRSRRAPRVPARATREDRVGRSEKRSAALTPRDARPSGPRAPSSRGPRDRGTGDLRGLSCLRAPARDAPEARTAVRECSGASREETSRKTRRKRGVRGVFRLTNARQSQSFRRRFRALRKPRRLPPRRDAFKDGFSKTVHGQTPPIKHRSYGRVCIFRKERFTRAFRTRRAFHARVTNDKRQTTRLASYTSTQPRFITPWLEKTP